MLTKGKRLKRIGAALCAALILITIAVIPVSASAETSQPLSVENPITNNPYFANVESQYFKVLQSASLQWSYNSVTRELTITGNNSNIYDYFGNYIQYSENYCNYSCRIYSVTQSQYLTLSSPYLDVKTLYYMGSAEITLNDNVTLSKSASGNISLTFLIPNEYGTLADGSAFFNIYQNPYAQGFERAQTWYENYITQAEQTYLENLNELQETIDNLRETIDQPNVIPNLTNGFLRGIAQVIETFDGVELFGFTGQDMITYALTILVLVIFVKLVVFII